MRTRELTPTRRRRDHDPGAPVTIGLDICRSALSSLSHEIVESTVGVVSASLHQQGLRGDIDDYEVLRQVLRNIVADDLGDMLSERIKEIDDEPDPHVRARLIRHRERLIELLSEYRR